jgi:hypothetical protein
MKVKAFFERYSYEIIVHLFLYQIVISMFGFSLAMATAKADNDTLLLWSSIGAIAFFLILIYGSAWKIGAKDKLSIEFGKLTYKPLRGLFLSFLANSLNFLMAILITIGVLAGIGGLESIGRLVALLTQGMYQGVMAVVKIGDAPLHSMWWAYFLTSVPAMLVTTIGYIAGAKDFHITSMGIPELPESDRPSRKELKEQKELEKKGKK